MNATPEEIIKKAAESFAHDQPDQEPRQQSGSRVDVAKYLSHYGKPFMIKQHEAGTIYCLENCPFDTSHVSESSIIQRANGMLLFQCFHDSCKEHTWKEARTIISGNDSMAPFMSNADIDQATYATSSSEPAPLVNDTPVNDWPDPPDEAVFYGLAGEFCRMIEPQTEADPVAILAQFLVGVGNVMGRSPFFSVEATRHHTNEYLLLSGVTAKGRKGTAWEHDRRLLAATDPAWAANCIKAGLVSGEGLIYHVRDAQETTVKRNDRDEGVPDKRLLVLEPEFAGILKVIARRDNSLSSTMRSAWDTGYLSTLAKNSPLKATGAHISVISHVTQNELIRLLTETESANGFINRFLIMCVRRSKMLPEGGDPVNIAFFVADLKATLEFASSVGELKRDAEAREMWATVYPHLTRDIPGMSGAILSREAAHVVRLSLIYALLDRSTEIKAPHLLAALALWEYVERSVHYIFGDRTGDPIADKIYDAAMNAGTEGITRTYIYTTLFQKHEKRENIDRAIKVLNLAGRITVIDVGTAGRSESRIIAKRKKTSQT